MITDVCILIVLALFIFNGYRRGFIKSVYSLLSLFITYVLVSLLEESFIEIVSQSPASMYIGEFVAGKTGNIEIAALCSEKIIYLLSSVVLYILIRIGLKFGLTIINSIASLPLIKSLNKVLGFVLGAIIGIIWIVIILNVLSVFPQTENYIIDSKIVDFFKLILI